MATIRLSKRTVEGIGPTSRTTFFYDTELKGFGVKVMPSGVKTFIVEYRPGAGGRGAPKRRLTIGRFGALTVEEARDIAKTSLGLVHSGGDPAANRTKARAEITVGELCDLYLQEGCETKKPSTLITDRSRIERHIKPLLGRKKISEIARPEIERFLRDVAAGKTATDVKTGKFGRAIVEGGKGAATRTVGLLGGIMSFAVSRRLRTDNPVHGVKRYADKKGERFLSTSELGRIGAEITKAEQSGANPNAIAIIRLLAFTGARKSEISCLRWSEVDLENGYLRLGDSKTGAKVIPIGPPARQVLAGLPVIENTPYVFPAATGLGSFQGVDKVWRIVREAADLSTIRLHDLRHSFASVGLSRGDALVTIGAILGHADIKTTSRYAHLANDPVKRAADDISQSIDAAFSGRPSADVVSFPGDAKRVRR